MAIADKPLTLGDARMEDWLTTADAAALSGYHLEHIRRLIRSGAVVARKWGRDWQVSRNRARDDCADDALIRLTGVPRPRMYRWLVLVFISLAMFGNYYVFDAMNPVGPLLEGDDDPRMEQKRKIVGRKGREFITAWKDRTDYLEDPTALRLALDQYESWKRRYGSDGDEGYYFWLRTQQDQLSPKLKARFNKIEEFSKKIENDIQFFYLRIGRIPLERFLWRPQVPEELD